MKVILNCDSVMFKAELFIVNIFNNVHNFNTVGPCVLTLN